jgi:hypothetical protein
MTLPYLQALKQRFSNQPNYLHTSEGVNRLPFTSFETHWIVGRGKCMFRCENLDHVPKPKREVALANQVKLWSPFQQTAHHCIWADGTAMIWFWDAQFVADGISESDVPVDRPVHVLPETLYYPRLTSGLYLQDCRDGYELQYWRSGVLKDDVWMPAEPVQRQLAQFCDRNGISAQTLVRAPAVNLCSEPWTAELSLKDWLLVNEKRLAVACLALF